jgi:hypothetical protein
MPQAPRVGIATGPQLTPSATVSPDLGTAEVLFGAIALQAGVIDADQSWLASTLIRRALAIHQRLGETSKRSNRALFHPPRRPPPRAQRAGDTVAGSTVPPFVLS